MSTVDILCICVIAYRNVVLLYIQTTSVSFISLNVCHMFMQLLIALHALLQHINHLTTCLVSCSFLTYPDNSDHLPHIIGQPVVSHVWAEAPAWRLQVSLSCAVFCHIVSLQYLSRSSLHRLAGLPCRVVSKW